VGKNNEGEDFGQRNRKNAEGSEKAVRIKDDAKPVSCSWLTKSFT
jgi:hypothetical protein